MSHSTTKPTFWTLRKVSTQINLSMPRRLTKTDTFLPHLIFMIQESLLYTSIPLRRNVSVRISLHGLCRLIWVNTLRRVHNIGFLVEKAHIMNYFRYVKTLIFFVIEWNYFCKRTYVFLLVKNILLLEYCNKQTCLLLIYVLSRMQFAVYET